VCEVLHRPRHVPHHPAVAGTLGFLGAAPPPGDHAHRYIFAVHALDAPIDVRGSIGCTPAAFQMLFHTLARMTLTPTYQR